MWHSFVDSFKSLRGQKLSMVLLRENDNLQGCLSSLEEKPPEVTKGTKFGDHDTSIYDRILMVSLWISVRAIVLCMLYYL